MLAAKPSPCTKLMAYKVRTLFIQNESRALRYKFIQEQYKIVILSTKKFPCR